MFGHGLTDFSTATVASSVPIRVLVWPYQTSMPLSRNELVRLPLIVVGRIMHAQLKLSPCSTRSSKEPRLLSQRAVAVVDAGALVPGVVVDVSERMQIARRPVEQGARSAVCPSQASTSSSRLASL